MLFNTLKLFGLDVPAKVDAAKAVIEQRVEEVADRAKHLALNSAIIVACSAPWPSAWACLPSIGPKRQCMGWTSHSPSSRPCLSSLHWF
jgi:hypothetical protein